MDGWQNKESFSLILILVCGGDCGAFSFDIILSRQTSLRIVSAVEDRVVSTRSALTGMDLSDVPCRAQKMGEKVR